MAVVEACNANGVRHCVITSSIAAVMGTDNKPADGILDESHWSNPDRVPSYRKSKTLAEKAAWDY